MRGLRAFFGGATPDASPGPPFEAALEPERGDLIYGRTDARAAYMAWMPPRLQARVVADHAWVAIDNYNAAFAPLEYAFLEDDAAKDRLRARAERSPRSPDAARAYRQGAQRDAFFGVVTSSSRFGGAAVRDARPDALAREVVPALASDLRKQMQRKLLRRLCKAGIAVLTTHPAFAYGGAKLHFVLDGIDMAAVASKATMASYSRETDGTVPITSSELRYVFRNWAALSSTVLFYVAGRRVPAPWDEDWRARSLAGYGLPEFTSAARDAWIAYGEARARKHDGAPPARALY